MGNFPEEGRDPRHTPSPGASSALQFYGASEPTTKEFTMKSLGPCALSCALLCVLVGGQVARADDDEVVSFKKDKDRETKEFVGKVGTSIIKVARSKPQKMELEKYEYTKPKAGRTELKMKMIY